MSTSLLSNVTLATGAQSATVTVSESDEQVGLRVTSTQIGTASSQCRLVCLDSLGRVKKTVLINGSGTEETTIDQVDGDLTCHVECLAGSCRIALDQLDGAEKLGETTGAVVTADIADLAVTTGKIALASVDTAQLAAGAATLPKFDHTGIKVLRFDGKNGAGAITLTGAAVGDRVLAVFGVTSATGATVVGGTDFETAITVINQIQQSLAGDLSGNDYVALLIPAQA